MHNLQFVEVGCKNPQTFAGHALFKHFSVTIEMELLFRKMSQIGDESLTKDHDNFQIPIRHLLQKLV